MIAFSNSIQMLAFTIGAVASLSLTYLSVAVQFLSSTADDFDGNVTTRIRSIPSPNYVVGTKKTISLARIDDGTTGRKNSLGLQEDVEFRKPGRFPQYGTEEFFERCPWTSRRTIESKTECYFLVRPKPTSNEGLAAWVAQLATGSLLASQAGCRMRIDYGPDIHVDEVLAPVDALRNWTVPDGFDCRQKNCYRAVSYNGCTKESLIPLSRNAGKDVLPVPSYRFIYNRKVEGLNQFEELSKALPGFDVRTGFACAVNSEINCKNGFKIDAGPIVHNLTSNPGQGCLGPCSLCSDRKY